MNRIIIKLMKLYILVALLVLMGMLITRKAHAEERTEVKNVTVYHVYDFGLNNGALGGAMLSRRLQGEHSLPKDYDIINRPFSFYETYKGIVLSVLTAFAVLLIFALSLLIYIIRIRKMKKKLIESHEEQKQLYEELAASEAEMRKQYDEIIDNNEKIRKGEEKLTFLAYHDYLTGLPNKLSLYDSQHIFSENRGKVALLFADIDNFKFVNDTLGHVFGDQLIIKVSERLKSLSANENSVFRLGGDEFILLLEGIQEIEEAECFASRIMNHFLEEFEIQDSILHVSLSIGIVLYPKHGNDLEQLLKFADIALHKAKESGRKNFMVYDHLMNQVLTERVDIEKHLHNAIENKEFRIFYQPQYDLKNNHITGLEALLRWTNPVLGNVPPNKFIKIAEDTRYIIPLGTWVLQQACSFLKKLQKLGYNDLSVSVNISILQLFQIDFCEIVERTLKEYQIKPNLLELEITETILMESFEAIIPKLEKLSRMQVRIALDDFGKGYSSLNYLKHLPINTLKVDKSFIDFIIDPEKDYLTGQIIIIGKSMGMCVIAEGVERQEQLEYLVRHRCDRIQGYLYSRPVSEDDILKLLESNKPFSSSDKSH